MSKPIRLRGLKYGGDISIRKLGDVEAYTASWIEMISVNEYFLETRVEAYTASWIEICHSGSAYFCHSVEAYTASWIEIENEKE